MQQWATERPGLDTTGKAVTGRIIRLAALERTPNPNDRRGTLVRLTDPGREAIEAAIDLQADVERRLVDALTAKEVDQLVGLLRKLLLAADPEGR